MLQERSFVACGLFDEMIGAVAALSQRGVELFLHDTDVAVICSGVLRLIRHFTEFSPECAQKIRGVSAGLALCMEHNLIHTNEIALTSGMGAGLLCAKVFGRDEETAGTGFKFTQNHVDAMICGWKEIMRPTTWGKIVGSPSPDR